METGLKFLTFDILSDNRNEDVCFFSQSWLNEGEIYAYIPTADWTLFRRLVGTTTQLSAVTLLRPVKIWCIHVSKVLDKQTS